MFGFLGTASHQGVKKGVGGGHSREKTCFFWGQVCNYNYMGYPAGT